jgi:hypothetical protein
MDIRPEPAPLTGTAGDFQASGGSSHYHRVEAPMV